MKVSIITPVFNQVEFIEETVRSVLDQDYPDIEYLVLDDGSSDDIEGALKPYRSKLQFIRHPNAGESKTVNKGLRLITGEIVGVVNSDDPLYSPKAVSTIVRYFRDDPDILAAYPDWVSINEHGDVLQQIRQKPYDIDSMLVDFNVAIGPGMFIRRKALDLVGTRNEDLKYTGDLDLSFRLALAGKLAHIPEYLATHRIHSKAASSAARGSQMAYEIVRLAQTCIDSPLLPDRLRSQRKWVIGHSYFVAASYCGTNSDLRGAYMRMALKTSPFRIGHMIVRQFLITRIRKMMSGLHAMIPRGVEAWINGVAKTYLPVRVRDRLLSILRSAGFYG